MLMNEVASAADTLELWKMINDSVWASLQRLQKQENERRAAQRRASAPKPAPRKPSAATHKNKVASMPRFTPVPLPSSPRPQALQAPSTQAASSQGSVAQRAAQGAAPSPQRQLNLGMNAAILPINARKKSGDETDDRYSKNTLPR